MYSTGADKSVANDSELEELIKQGNVDRIRVMLEASDLNLNRTFSRSDTFKGEGTPMYSLLVINAARGTIKDAWLESLLDVAIIHDKLEIVRLLVERGANIHCCSGYFNAPPLFLAISLKREGIAQYLIGKGADVNFTAPRIIKEFGKNTLGIMAEGYCCVCPTQRNAMTTAKGMERIPVAANISILHLAAIVGCSEEMFALLLSKGADANATALLMGRSPSEHLYQIWCTQAGLLAQLLSLFNVCAANIADHIVACCMPGIHARSFMGSVSADIPKKAWELLKAFHPDASSATIDMLKASTTVRHEGGREEPLLGF